MPLSVDASNSCIPPSCNLIVHVPPLPTTVRGVPLSIHGDGGRFNSNNPPLVVYPSGRLVVVRELSSLFDGYDGRGMTEEKKVRAFVYRGHTANVTTAKFSPSGCYIASGDTKGKLRVWAYDNEEHLCKLDITALSGPIRDVSWDVDSKRIVVVGEGSKADPSSMCTKVIQWDTGVSCGQLGQHTFKKASSCSFKPCRPMRIVTGGAEDSKCLLNAGPPFKRISDGVSESCHVRGAVHCIRYNPQGTMVASVGTDKTVCFYDGKTMELIKKMESVHNSSIYSCSWNGDGDELLTCSADGTAKLISVKKDFQVTQTWNVANITKDEKSTKVPLGAMQMGCAFVKGNQKVSVSLNGKITMLPMAKASSSAEEFKYFTGHQSPISCMAVDYSTETLYSGDSDGVICTWNIKTGDSISYVQRDENTEEGLDDTLMNKVHQGAITGIVSSRSGTCLSIGWDDKIRFIESSTAKSSVKLQSQPNKIVKGTELVVVMTVDGVILVWSKSATSNVSENFCKLPYEPTTVCVSPDDRIVYVGGKDCTIHIYSINDNDTLDEIHTLSGTHLQPIYALSISNDGKKLASADVRDICVWNIEEDYHTVIGKGRWCFHNQKINALTWSNDDTILASGGSDDSIYIWSLKKPVKRIHYGFAHRGGITGLEFLKNKDGNILASVGNDGCVNQWDVTDDVMKKFG